MLKTRHQLAAGDRVRARLAYTVRCDGFVSTAWTWADALAWATCFPASFGRVTISKRGRVIAIRSTSEV